LSTTTNRKSAKACYLFAAACALSTAAAPAPGAAQAEEPEFNPASVSVVDAIECRLQAPVYNGFAWALNGEEKLVERMHWTKIENDNPFLSEYDLPEPITVAGHYSTRRVAFTSTGVLAVLDLPDPGVLGAELKIENEMSADPMIEAIVASGKATRAEVEAEITFRKFLGQKIVSDTQRPPEGDDSFGDHTVISLNVSNVTSHPGKTFYGCSYKMELTDKDGNPL
jgi:hypothetical protein